MQPENSRSVSPSAEQLPMPPSVGPEAVPQLPPLHAAEAAPLGGGERFEQAAEAGARTSDATAAASTAATIAVPVAPVQAPPTAQASSTTPLVAADEDLIEKEWVDKAKEIIGQTQGDPHARSQKVSELQRDYLQKRYGKVIGASE